jgi:hypothetical protein
MAGVAFTAQEQNEMLHQVGAALATATLDEWNELHFVFRAVVDATSADFVVVRPDRSTVGLPPPRKAMRLMEQLRPGMYQPGRGVWFTATYRLAPDRRHQVYFDYDNEPAFAFDLYSESFDKDLAMFPRERHNIPPWLQRRLDIAGA